MGKWNATTRDHLKFYMHDGNTAFRFELSGSVDEERGSGTAGTTAHLNHRQEESLSV